MTGRANAPYFVAIDIGGTFTDCLVEHDGAIEILKVSTTPGRFEVGFVNALEAAADRYGLSPKQFLARTARIVHGSTVSTNALVERREAKTGLLCTAGHPDILALREAVPKPVFDWRRRYPDPFIPRSLTVEVRGRMSGDGLERYPLSESDVRTAAERFRQADVEAIAVSFLWSIVNNDHEIRAAEIINAVWPEVPVVLGHRVNPINREYPRTIATAIDASLHPLVSQYLAKIEGALQEAGFDGDLLIANCLGGMMPPADIVDRPIYSVMSGPTLAPFAARALTRRQDILVADMGGTTFDVSAIRDGEIIVSAEAVLGDDLLGVPKVDVRSVGAGGGSIAWIDAGGLLRVGPQSAGAVPGPACYGRGGTLPTVTDANVALGFLDPVNFASGSLDLNVSAARDALRTIADPLGLTIEEAAYSVYATSNNLMVGAIQDITVAEGIDPRDSLLVVGGGATSAHIVDIAAELGITDVLIPHFASGLSAFGGLIGDIRWEEQGIAFTDSDTFSVSGVRPLLHGLRARAESFLSRAGVAAAQREFAYFFKARYRYQSWEIEVPFQPRENNVDEGDMDSLVESFHRMHQRIYGVSMPSDTVEFTNWAIRATGISTMTTAEAVKPQRSKPAVPKGTRRFYDRSLGGMVKGPIFDGTTLLSATFVESPAIIEEPTTTIVLPTGSSATRDQSGNYHLDIEPRV